MAKNSLNRKDDAAEIDMTPMLDIVFIMLIFFIVTTSFVKEAGVQVLRPTNTKTAIKKSNANLFIAITKTGDVFMDNKLVKVEKLKVEVQRIKAESPEGAVVIQADQSSKAGVVMKVLDAVRGAGVKDVSIAATLGD